MRKGSMLLFVLLFLLTFNLSVLADEGHGHDEKIKNAAENFRNGNTGGADAQGNNEEDASHHDAEDGHGGGHSDEEESHGEAGSTHDDSSSQEDESSHDDSGAHNEEDSSHDDSGVHNEEDSSHDDGGAHNEEDSSHDDGGAHDDSGGHSEEAIIEPGPDYKVLGAFGVVNLTFLIIGMWNKWFRRKGE